MFIVTYSKIRNRLLTIGEWLDNPTPRWEKLQRAVRKEAGSTSGPHMHRAEGQEEDGQGGQLSTVPLPL